MKFLGTAAADGLPGPFCACRTCQDARRRPERQRMRSMFMLDEKTLIDFGPDLCAACARQGLDMSALDTVFITHTHEDHFCPSNAGLIHVRSSHPESADAHLREYPRNFVLAAIHHASERIRKSIYTMPPGEVPDVYFEEPELLLDFGSFDSPARFDDPLRLPALLQAQFLPEYEDRIRQLMKRLAQMGKGLELNTGGRGIPWAASARNVGP